MTRHRGGNKGSNKDEQMKARRMLKYSKEGSSKGNLGCRIKWDRFWNCLDSAQTSITQYFIDIGSRDDNQRDFNSSKAIFNV